MKAEICFLQKAYPLNLKKDNSRNIFTRSVLNDNRTMNKYK